MALEIRHVQYFVAVADAGSFGRASAALGISQPALSKSVRQLEQSLGSPLLDRSPRGSALTPVGEAFLTHARAILVETQNAKFSVRALRDGHRGDIAVGISPSLARHVMPIAAARMVSMNAGNRLKIQTGMVDDLLARVRNGSLDLAISAMPNDYSDPELTHERLAVDQLEIVTRVGHPLRRAGDITLGELIKYPWIVPSGAASGRSGLEQAFLVARLPLPRPAIETDSITFIRSFLPHTDFVSILPLSLLDGGDGPWEIAAVPVKGHTWSRPIMVTYRTRTSLSGPARQLLNDVRATLEGVCAGARRRNET